MLLKKNPSKPVKKEETVPKDVYSEPRAIHGVAEFGFTSTDSKMLTITLDGVKDRVHGYELPPNPAAYQMTRPFMTMTTTLTDENGAAKIDAEGFVERPQVGIIFSKPSTAAGLMLDGKTWLGKITPRFVRIPGRMSLIKLTADGAKLFGLPEGKEIQLCEDPKGGTNHTFNIYKGKGNVPEIGTFEGDFRIGTGTATVNGVELQVTMQPPEDRYRILCDADDANPHPNRTAYPTGPILIDTVDDQLLQVARVVKSETKNGGEKMMLTFNGQRLGKAPHERAFIFKKSDEALEHSVMRFTEGENAKLVEVGKMTGKWDDNKAEITIDNKNYTYIVPAGNIILENQKTKRKKQPKKSHILELNSAEYPLTIDMLITSHVAPSKRATLNWEGRVPQEIRPTPVLQGLEDTRHAINNVPPAAATSAPKLQRPNLRDQSADDEVPAQTASKPPTPKRKLL